ncbi:MAG: peptide chain release factor 2 [Spirochaeta sp.]
MIEELYTPINALREDILQSWRHLDPDAIEAEIAEYEQRSADPNLWDDREAAEKTMQKLKNLQDQLAPWKRLLQESEDILELLELAKEEGDPSQEEEIRSWFTSLSREYERLRIVELLSEPHDDAGAILTIHAGAGGTEACDWVSMLYRMYTRWIERRGFSAVVLDLLEAEGGIKSVTIEVTGMYAFGYLKAENGVHRLVRISPFDSSGRRHTSFASVFVSPIVDDDIEIEINPDDIRVDTYRASGAGGQHVNKTDSAVRITHLETGVVVQCQNERSQHKNRANAMKVLKSRLYERRREELEQEKEAAAGEKRDISWGNQIRSYVFQPYTMVKDHRTKVESGNVQAVMDGDIDQFIEGFLQM